MLLKTIELKDRKQNIYYLKGQVIESNQWNETKVFGRGGGGYIHEGSGYVKPMNISSETVNYEKVFLLDDLGKEHALSLANISFDARVGHELTFVWVVEEGEESGPYLMVINHNLEQLFWQEVGLNQLYAPNFKQYFANLWRGYYGNWIFYAILAFLLISNLWILSIFICSFWFGYIVRKKNVLAKKQVNKIMSDFRQEPVIHSIVTSLGVS